MTGKGIAYGAATVVNAMPSGCGAAFGVGLKTFAEVDLTDDCGTVEVEIAGGANDRKQLAVESFKVVLERFGLRYGGRIRTRSDIPIACGMKSSSVASNAIILATLDAIGQSLDEMESIKLGVDASLRAKVTLTGAFDDACASFLGGLHVTDNRHRSILKSYELGQLGVVFLVPEGKRYSGEVDRAHINSYARASTLALDGALNGNYWQAMLLNGLVMAHAFGADPSPMLAAMKNGAISAGLSGKGPAICAVARNDSEDSIVEGWKSLGLDLSPGYRIIRTKTNSDHSRKGF